MVLRARRWPPFRRFLLSGVLPRQLRFPTIAQLCKILFQDHAEILQAILVAGVVSGQLSQLLNDPKLFLSLSLQIGRFIRIS